MLKILLANWSHLSSSASILANSAVNSVISAPTVKASLFEVSSRPFSPLWLHRAHRWPCLVIRVLQFLVYWRSLENENLAQWCRLLILLLEGFRLGKSLYMSMTYNLEIARILVFKPTLINIVYLFWLDQLEMKINTFFKQVFNTVRYNWSFGRSYWFGMIDSSIT